MTKTVYNTATTINGFIADEKNSLDWLFEVPQDGGTDNFGEFLDGVGAMCMGATTYEWILANHGDPQEWQEFYADRPTWVLTHRELPPIPGANLRFAAGDVGVVHEEMVRAADGKDVWLVGGGELVGAFADQGLLDEVRFSLAPALVVGGAPLLPRRLTSSRLKLVEAKRNGQFVELVYSVGND